MGINQPGMSSPACASSLRTELPIRWRPGPSYCVPKVLIMDKLYSLSHRHATSDAPRVSGCPWTATDDIGPSCSQASTDHFAPPAAAAGTLLAPRTATRPVGIRVIEMRYQVPPRNYWPVRLRTCME